MAKPPPPMVFSWDGEVMRPRLPRLADRHYVVGETYTLEVREERSSASHRHLFAAVREAWENLPEHLVEQIPSAEHLRKLALIRSGYRDERSLVCESEEQAEKVACFLRPKDEFAVIGVNGPVIVEWTAKSQSSRAMSKAEFQASKDAVLEFCARLLDTTRQELEQHASEAA